MFKTLFLILFVFSFSAFGQTTQEKPKAYKLFEFGKISNRLLMEKVEAFRSEIVNVKLNEAKGFIIHYRKQSKIDAINMKIRNSLPLNCGYDGEICGRIIFIDGKNVKADKTEFWIVPDGAEMPLLN